MVRYSRLLGIARHGSGSLSNLVGSGFGGERVGLLGRKMRDSVAVNDFVDAIILIGKKEASDFVVAHHPVLSKTLF